MARTKEEREQIELINLQMENIMQKQELELKLIFQVKRMLMSGVSPFASSIKSALTTLTR